MGFCREVHHSVEALLGKEAFKETLVPYISMDETMSIRQASGKILKIGEVPRVGQGIQIDNTPVLPRRKDVTDKVRPDKTGTSGDQ
jgi:hypothetical protein